MILSAQLPRMYGVVYSPSGFWDSLFQDFGQVLSGNKSSWFHAAAWCNAAFGVLQSFPGLGSFSVALPSFV